MFFKKLKKNDYLELKLYKFIILLDIFKKIIDIIISKKN